MMIIQYMSPYHNTTDRHSSSSQNAMSPLPYTQATYSFLITARGKVQKTSSWVCGLCTAEIPFIPSCPVNNPTSLPTWSLTASDPGQRIRCPHALEILGR